MSRKEVHRAVVFERVVGGELRLKEAAELLGISYRQAKRLCARFRQDGAAGLVHGNVGRPSNAARAPAERQRVEELIREHYGGQAMRGPGQRFGPTLASEHLNAEHGLRVPANTLRDWMLASGLWSRVRRRKPAPRRRERRAHFGELVQLDGSFHDWYEGRGSRAGQRSCMMNMVDDATGTTLLRFGDQETIWAAADILGEWVARHGVPRALYTDWKNVYKREPTAKEAREGTLGHTQFGRMCAKLGIEIIAANSPQAKGRVERSNGIQQDRLIKSMRVRGISEDEAANEFVRTHYLPQLNARFAVTPASPLDYHLPRDPGLADRDVFCLEHTRTVGGDYVVQFGRRALQLSPSIRGRVPAGSKILVREDRAGNLRLVHVNRRGEEREYRWTDAARGPRAPRAATKTQRRGEPQKPNRPSAEHPWRKQNAQGVAQARMRRVALNGAP